MTQISEHYLRFRDKAFTGQKEKHGKRNQHNAKGQKNFISASEFPIDAKNKICICPAGKSLWFSGESRTVKGNRKLYFEGNLSDCRNRHLKEGCMRNPSSPDAREGHDRQVSTTVSNGHTATDWMKRRIDSQEGKVIYGHRMSVVEPVFGKTGLNKSANRFSLPRNEKVQGQWRMFCLVHNIAKLMNYGVIQ